ncbi:hypothetical protein JF540_22975 [Salipiger thiooxidans]|uniref:hypothetical protein n=1 Tax=Salipiger thiooxidans TaxID=282683 RepID=UPI001A8CB1B5|nr:hypothetical protein [Salipiger thiooxidans]MBN8189553.1 hypothetical protein [Salipiger thiooxidans]
MADLFEMGTVRASERGADLEILGPGNVGKTDVVFEVLGFDAEVVVQAAREFDRVEAKRPAEDREKDTDTVRIRRDIALATAAVTGWSNVQMKGKDAEFTPELWAEMAADPNYRFLVRQVVAFGGNLGSFFPKASTD